MKRGFTIVEVLIYTTCVAILFAILFKATTPAGGPLSFGANGLVETRCVNGLLFTVGHGGQARQVLGENGGGVPCE